MHLETAANLCVSRCQAKFLSQFFSILSWEVEQNTYWLAPRETVSFVSPQLPVFLLASPRGTLTVSGKQNSLFPLGLVIKCLLSCISRVHKKSKIYKDWAIFQLFQTWKSMKKYEKPRSQTLCILQPIRQPFSSGRAQSTRQGLGTGCLSVPFVDVID